MLPLKCEKMQKQLCQFISLMLHALRVKKKKTYASNVQNTLNACLGHTKTFEASKIFIGRNSLVESF